MADRRIAGQPIDHVAPREGVADQSKPALRMKPFAVECDDPSRLLTAMLQGMQAERGNRRRVGMPEYAEYAALLTKPICVGIEGGRHGHDLGTSTRSSPLRRWSGAAGGLSVSSGLARFSLFKMVLSGSSGNIDISHCPVPARTTLDLAPLTHCGWLRSGTSQMKNWNAMTTMIRPRARPNKNPSVRSSAPTRLSSTMSETLMVNTETIRSVSRNTLPTTATAATISLLKYCLA